MKEKTAIIEYNKKIEIFIFFYYINNNLRN